MPHSAALKMWKPWFEGLETPADLGQFHAMEDRAAGSDPHYHPGCLMTPEELDEYHEAYDNAFNE